MNGPHPDVKIASPIPTGLFSPVPNIGTNRPGMMTNVFQAHTGGHNMLPGTHATFGAIPIPDLGNIKPPNFIDLLRGWWRKQNTGVAQPY